MDGDDPAISGFTTSNDYILGASNEQMTELAMDTNQGVMAVQHNNIWADGRLLGTYDPDGTHFYFNDPLGTRRAQASGAGVLEQTCLSLPYGNAESCPPSPTEHLFTGKERDEESGLDYFGARYYGSNTGRWMSPDWSVGAEPVPYARLADPQSLNLYLYVENNPLREFDPDGHVGLNSGPAEECLGNATGSACATPAEINASIKNFSSPSEQAQQNQVTATWNGKTSVTYTYPDGSTVTRTGTHPWRDNSPGDLTGGHGSIGRDAGGGNVMAIYPSEEAGWNALGLTLTGKYAGTSIIDTMKAFTPAGPKGNDPVAYANMLANAVGVPVSTRISDLSPAQLTTVEVNIARQEGYFASTNSISATNPQ